MSAPARTANPWALPEARVVLPAGAPRQRWLAERRTGIGGSDIAVLMGVAHQHATEYALWCDKAGTGGPDVASWAMERGTWLEGPLAEHFAAETGLAVRRCGLLRRRDQPVALATLDRLTADGGALEVKTINPRATVATEWKGGGIARHAYAQLQWQLLVSGRSHGWLVAYELDSRPMIRGPVERDEPLMARMRDRALAWWAAHVVTGTPPAPDLATITDEEIAVRWPQAEPGSVVQAQWPAHLRALLVERAECHTQLTDAEKRKKEIDQALKVMVGDAEALLIGERPVMTLKEQAHTPSVDPALPVDHPEIDQKYIRRGRSRRIHIVKDWELA